MIGNSRFSFGTVFHIRCRRGSEPGFQKAQGTGVCDGTVLRIERATGVMVGYNDKQRCKSSTCFHQTKSLFFTVTISACLTRRVCDDHQFVIQSTIGSA